MDIFKAKRFRFTWKLKAVKKTDHKNNGMQAPEEWNDVIMESKEDDLDGLLEEDDDDEDDFITNEVKRRIKELRKNTFMVLIPEESCLEDDDEMSSNEWRESEVEDVYRFSGFDSLYSSYCERMLYFDKMIAQNLNQKDSWNIPNQTPRYSTKKLALAFKSLSFKRQYDILGDCEQLHPPLKIVPIDNLETAYVSHVCLSWEALHCQYIQLSQLESSQLESPFSYSRAAQEFQQFQVLLLRFIENEPFEQGTRVDIYARARSSLPKLLQVPNSQDRQENDSDDADPAVLASQLLNLIKSSILTFRWFLKKDKNQHIGSLNFFKAHSPDACSLHQVQTSLAKKQIKVKELSKKKSWKNSWPATSTEVELLFSLIDIEVVGRALRMPQISKEQLLWCEEKMSKLDLSDNRLCRNTSPFLFPC